MKFTLTKSTMPIASSDLDYRLSGGAANANANASLGGAISSVSAGATIFDDVSSAEAAAGRIEYRGVYVKNNHATLTLYGATAWLTSNTPSATTDAALGLGTSALNAQEQTIANETTAPAGVTFSSPSAKGSGISLGDIPPGGTRFVWMRRTVNAGSASLSSDPFILRVEGDTA